MVMGLSDELKDKKETDEKPKRKRRTLLFFFVRDCQCLYA